MLAQVQNLAILCTLLALFLHAQSVHAFHSNKKTVHFGGSSRPDASAPKQAAATCHWFSTKKVHFERMYKQLNTHDVYLRKAGIDDIISELDDGRELAEKEGCESEYKAYFKSMKIAMDAQSARYQGYLQLRSTVELSLISKNRWSKSSTHSTFLWTLDTLQRLEAQMRRRVLDSSPGKEDVAQDYILAEITHYQNTLIRLHAMMNEAGLHHIASMHYLEILPLLPRFLQDLNKMSRLPFSIRYLFMESLVRLVEQKVFTTSSLFDDLPAIKPVLLLLYRTAGKTEQNTKIWSKYQERLDALPSGTTMSLESDFSNLKNLEDVLRNRGTLVYLYVPKSPSEWLFTSLDRQQY